MPLLPPLRLTGATILRDGELRQRSVAVERGRISKGPLPAVELDGYLILPGMIDLMGGLPEIEGPATPAGQVKAAQAAAAASGVTTAWAAVGWSWQGGKDCPSRAAPLAAAVARSSGGIDLRPALRVEVSRSDTGPELLDLISRLRPELVYFQNRRESLSELTPEEFARAAAQEGLDVPALHEALSGAKARLRDLPRHLCRIAESLDAIGAQYGSLDDSGGDIRETYSMIGARLATCPAAHSAAAAARAMDNPVLLAPEENGGCEQFLRAGLGTALVSRGDWPALLAQALRLAGPDYARLPKIWPLVSSAPAEIIGLPDRGSLDLGRRADLIAVNMATRAVEVTISAGRLVHLSGEARDRFRRAWNNHGLSGIAAE